MSDKDASYGHIMVGENKIDLQVEYALGSLGIVRINPDGSFFVEVQEIVLNETLQVDQKVHLYDANGNLEGMAHVPLAYQYVPVSHSLAVGPDSEVYTLLTKPDGVEIQRLNFRNELSPILMPPKTLDHPGEPLGVLEISADCISRTEMLAVGLRYMNNSTNLNSYHITDPNQECTTRTKPRYLGAPGIYTSVPYAWGQGDSIEQFNGFMQGGNNGFFAGDIDEPNPSNCGRGVDCAGFVSNAWHLRSRYGTCSLDTISESLYYLSELQPGDIMNRCDSPTRHVILFAGFGNGGSGGGMYGYEATTEINLDKVYWTFRYFSELAGYTPREYYNACYKYDLPLLQKSTTALNLVIPTPNAYPPPIPYP